MEMVWNIYVYEDEGIPRLTISGLFYLHYTCSLPVYLIHLNQDFFNNYFSSHL